MAKITITALKITDEAVTVNKLPNTFVTNVKLVKVTKDKYPKP